MAEPARTRCPAAERELLAKARARAAEGLQGLGETVEAIEEFARVSEDLSSRLHHEVLTSRMRPLADGVRGFPRLVRDLARELGKQARFEVAGETTGVDRDILDRLEAPLNHLIRNALDHGLETPEERRAAGKPPVGHHPAGGPPSRGDAPDRPHRRRPRHRPRAAAGQGRRARAGHRGDGRAGSSEAELLDFLFLPGFSTKEQVTEVSGRGVGLDVVQSMVHAVRGSVRVASRPGKGTRFVLQLPITVSVIRALLVEIAGEPYAFPLSRIDRILMLDRKDLRELEGKPHVHARRPARRPGRGGRVLELPADARPPRRRAVPVVVASDRSHRFGVVVDRFLGERDLRVSPLDARLGKVPNINSSSVLEDGWPVLIVDVEDLIRSIDNLLSGRRLGKLAAEASPSTRPARPSGSSSSTTRSPSASWSGSCSKAAATSSTSRSTASTAGTPSAPPTTTWWSATSTCRGWTASSSSGTSRTTPGSRRFRSSIVSYKDREEDRIKGLDAGADAYLTKSSFHDQTFLTTVADLIGEARE